MSDELTNETCAALVSELCEDYHGDTFHALCHAAAMLEMIPDGMTPEAVQWAVKIARRALRAEYAVTAIHLGHDCPPSVRAALRGEA